MTARLRRSRLAAWGAVIMLAAATAGCTGGTAGGGASTPPPSATGGTTAPTTGVTAPTAGPGVTPVGAKWDWGRFDSYRPYLASLSGGSTYYEFVWCDIEPSPGHRDWSTVDKVAQRTREIGMRLLLKIRVGRCWATSGEAQFSRGKANKTESGMPRDLAAYAAFVKEAVQRYSAYGVTEFALENEVNSPSYWGGTPDELRQLVTVGARAIHEADRQAKVVDFGLASTTYGYGIADDLLKAGDEAGAVRAYNQYYERRFGTRGARLPQVSTAAQLRQVLAAEQGVRNLTYLAMASELARQGVVDVRQFHFYEKWSNVPMLLAYLSRHTPSGTPIEAWEVGSFWKGAATDDAQRSDEMVKTVSSLLAGGVRTAIWLPLAVDPSGRNADEPRYGLIDPSGSVRAAGTAMSGIAEAARSAHAVPVAKDGLSGVGFEKGDTSTMYLWGSAGSVTVRSGASAGPVGATLRRVSAGQTVAVSEAPVEVRVDEPVATFLSGQR
ncbi:MAG TPA: hypothetical protein VFJ97_03205 [Dermatophilaceae bacterium]|nr:hypothetical protein [Dermatophilaceae bacterium]